MRVSFLLRKETVTVKMIMKVRVEVIQLASV